jgi:hypothetical protein
MPRVGIQRGISLKQTLRDLVSAVTPVAVGYLFTHHNRNTTEGKSASCDGQRNEIERYPIRQKLSRNPESSVTS